MLLPFKRYSRKPGRSISCGPVAIVVNAAGINLREPAEEITHASWDRTIDLNLAVPFFFTREFIAYMRAQEF